MVERDRCLLNVAVEDALRDGADAYDARAILVVPHLEARARLQEADEALYQAVYTLFRGLAERLAPGATLWVRTRDRADGRVELSWEAKEEPLASGRDAREVLRRGPYGDLLELAILGLETLCEAATAYEEEQAETPTRATASFLVLAPKVRRRYRFLMPGAAPSPPAAAP